MSDSDEENDDWYEQMADYAAHAYDDEPMDSMYHMTSALKEQGVDEMSYFQQIQDVNTSLSEQSFKTEDNYIWQNFARELAKDKSTNVNSKKGWQEVNLDEYSTVMILQQWLFSHLPYSFKLYNTLSTGSDFYRKQFRFFVDDKLHPSSICMMRYFAADKEIECCIFNPYKDNRPEALRSLSQLLAMLFQLYPGSNVELAATNTEYFEIYFPTFPRCTVNWVEYCHTYTLQSSIQTLLAMDMSLPEGYHFHSLS
jgi:hypothetical protein